MFEYGDGSARSIIPYTVIPFCIALLQISLSFSLPANALPNYLLSHHKNKIPFNVDKYLSDHESNDNMDLWETSMGPMGKFLLKLLNVYKRLRANIPFIIVERFLKDESNKWIWLAFA